ncbi:MAG: tRNA 2-selenouridine(34) synthase MnmH [Betaproteobacteria bacterium]|nr:tRNA 2-selenouridine(34) synthase MnmH [Betaproteobacteria bacterium]
MQIPVGQPGGFDAIIDARSEDEYALDHLPYAVNWPSLNNAERIAVGTMYKQVGGFEAQKHGAAMVAANVSKHIQNHVLDLPRNWQPLIYCWRGGKRSGSLAMVLGQIGFKINLMEGGYKAFRAAMLEDIVQLAPQFKYQVISGPTGSGKTRLLQALKAEGAQVLDLEDLAQHRSSVLGHIPGQPQPSQKHFDTKVWYALKQFDTKQVVFVESESRKVGNLTIPEAVILAMRNSPCHELMLPLEERVALLLEDYNFFVSDPELFCRRLDALVAIRGKVLVDAWKAQVQLGQFKSVVHELLETHYDPTYASSMRRNFARFEKHTKCEASNRHPETMRHLAQQLIAET